jgi:AmiR/NasT family two-component response regulator
MLNKSVLIAERNGIISLDLKLLLKKFNILSEIVFTADALTEGARLLRPDLIITDNDLDGREQVKDALKEISKNYHIPIIIISSTFKPGVEAFANSIPSCSAVTEPFIESDIIPLIQRYIFLGRTGNDGLIKPVIS